MRTKVFYLILFFVSTLPILLLATPSASQDDWAISGNDGKAIERVLRKQQEAWNRHDLAGFMTGYWNSSQLTFFSGGKENDGWQATMERYLATYASPGHEMGQLDFSNLRIEVLGQEGAFVRGTWKLTMNNGKMPHGLFTLIFRKFPDGWKIVHDHTSSAD
jgi:beta-aspartyl-peptidase (threonine type)